MRCLPEHELGLKTRQGRSLGYESSAGPDGSVPSPITETNRYQLRTTTDLSRREEDRASCTRVPPVVEFTRGPAAAGGHAPSRCSSSGGFHGLSPSVVRTLSMLRSGWPGTPPVPLRRLRGRRCRSGPALPLPRFQRRAGRSGARSAAPCSGLGFCGSGGPRVASLASRTEKATSRPQARHPQGPAGRGRLPQRPGHQDHLGDCRGERAT